MPPEGSRLTACSMGSAPATSRRWGSLLVKGGGFSEQDRLGATNVVVISQALAETEFAGRDPIGRRMKVGQGGDYWREIVGVVGDVKQAGLGEGPARAGVRVLPPAPVFRHVLAGRSGAPSRARRPRSCRSCARSCAALDRELPLARVGDRDGSRSWSPPPSARSGSRHC